MKIKSYCKILAKYLLKVYFLTAVYVLTYFLKKGDVVKAELFVPLISISFSKYQGGSAVPCTVCTVDSCRCSTQDIRKGMFARFYLHKL